MNSSIRDAIDNCLTLMTRHRDSGIEYSCLRQYLRELVRIETRGANNGN